MDTKEMIQDKISALADGELDDEQAEVVFALLRSAESLDRWDVYHQIGDALRSDGLAFNMRPDFAARMAARLAAEPAILAPISRVSLPETQPHNRRIAANDGIRQGIDIRQRIKRWSLTGSLAAVLAVAVTGFFAAPTLMTSLDGTKNDGSSLLGAQSVLASAGRVDPTARRAVPTGQIETLGGNNGGAVTMLRDPRIDDYLLAHQRFSPSLYSGAQYVRSASFANDSEK